MWSCAFSSAAEVVGKPLQAAEAGVIRVNSTVQSYNQSRPWLKRAPSTQRGLGAVVEGGRVLVLASLIGNHTYIELETAGDAQKSQAFVDVVDYECNLALLRPKQPEILAGLTPMTIAEKVRIGDELQVVQLEAGGTLAMSPGRVTAFQVGRYPIGEINLLLCRISLPLEPRDGSVSLPVRNGSGELAGMLLRHDSRTQSAEMVALPVLQRFLTNAGEPSYAGFGRVGLRFAPLRDQVLREYLGVPNGDRGVFIDAVGRGSPGEEAGLRPGDVLLTVGDYEIDCDGNFDHPIMGELFVAHLFSTEAREGDRVPVTVIRDGEPRKLEVKTRFLPPGEASIPAFMIDEAPPFAVVGGFVFVELTRQLLAEWGGRWERDAPLPLVYLDRFQTDLLEPNQRVVVISQVLPTEETIGYEDVQYLRVGKINGADIRNLEDLEEVLRNPVKGFHRIESVDDPHLIVLDAQRLEEVDALVLETFRLPFMKRMRGK